MLLDGLIGTTPAELTQLVREFCSTVSDAEPEYIKVRPEGEAGYCYPNVVQKVENEGGEIVYGRTIWLAKALIEAEWHCVWSKDGQLIDVTAKPDHEERILFVRTNEIWDGMTIFPNIRRLLTTNPRVRHLISMQESLERNATRLEDGRIRYDLAPLLRQVSSDLTPTETTERSMPNSVVLPQRTDRIGRNDPCPCRSGKKFKKCCMIRVN